MTIRSSMQITAGRLDTSRDEPVLTPRELEVFELIADGYSTREIARALWVSEETVKTHVKRVLERLQARTRAQAVAIAFRKGLWKPGAREEGPM